MYSGVLTASVKLTVRGPVRSRNDVPNIDVQNRSEGARENVLATSKKRKTVAGRPEPSVSTLAAFDATSAGSNMDKRKIYGDETESVVPSLKRPKLIFDRLEEAARNQAEGEPGTYAIVPDSFEHGPPDGRRVAFWWTRSMHVLQEKLKAFREKFPDACLLFQWQRQKRLSLCSNNV